MDLRNTIKRWSSGRVPPLAIAIILVAAVLRFYGLTKQPLWYDELVSLNIATYEGGLSSMWHVPFYPHPPLFNILLSFVYQLFTPSEFSARLLSLFAGVLGLALLYRLAADTANQRTALVAMALLAFSPMHLFFSQESRPYALLFAWVILTVWVLLKALEKNKTSWWLAHAVCVLVLLYLHFFAWFVVGGEILYVLLRWPKTRHQIAPFALSLAGMLLGALPLFLWLQDAQSVGKVTTVTNIVPIPVSFSSIWKTLTAGEGRYAKPALRLSGVLAFAVLALTGSVRLLKQRSALLTLILSMFGSALAFVFVLMPAIGQIVPAYQEKQFIAILPFALILATSGVEYLCSATRGGVLVAAFLVLTLLGGNALAIQRYHTSFEKNADVYWIEHLTARVEPEDVVVNSNMALAMNMKYHWPEDVPVEAVAWPYQIDRQWRFTDDLSSVPEGPYRWPLTFEDVLSHRRVWLVHQNFFSPDQLLADLTAQIPPTSVEQIGPFQVYLFVP